MPSWSRLFLSETWQAFVFPQAKMSENQIALDGKKARLSFIQRRPQFHRVSRAPGVFLWRQSSNGGAEPPLLASLFRARG
jgi:hypothetical protein